MTKLPTRLHSTCLRSITRVAGLPPIPPDPRTTGRDPCSRGPAARSAPALVALGLGLLIGLTSCAAPREPALGTATVNLVGQAPSGAVYRLRHAVITVTGPGVSRIWNTEDDLSRTSLSDDVPAGDYAASLAPGWNLERIAGASATAVVARLISDNPAPFVVSPEQRTSVPLRFHVDGDVIDMAQGYDLVLGVEESPPLRIIVTNADESNVPSIMVYDGHASGDVAPLQTITGRLTTLQDPAGVTATDDEIIVCDSDLDAIDVFPLHATGNVSPIRQIFGPDTGLDTCFDVAVDHGQLYVAQASDILVFPLTADGNVPPTQRISGRAIGQYLAIDHGELYESDVGFGFGDVVVFPLPLTDDTEATRSVDLRCASGIAVANGELFVADGCAGDGGISVYPATADGRVEPLRRLIGDATGLVDPAQIRHAQGELYVAEAFQGAILIFPDQASGSVSPIRAISGPHTGLFFPTGLAVH